MLSAVLGIVRDFVATRGAQLVSRYTAVGLVALAASTGVTVDAAGLSGGLGALIAGLALFGIDHFSHAKQAE